MKPKVMHLPWVQHLLRRACLDAVVATSSDHVFLLSGHSSWLERQMWSWMADPAGNASESAGYAVVTAAGDVGLVASPVVQAEARASGAGTVRIYERMPDGSGPITALTGLLADINPTDARIGVEFDGLDLATRAALGGGRRVDASLLLRLARMVNSPEAIRRLGAVTQATETVLSAVQQRWATLPDASAVQRCAREAFAREGSDLDHSVYGAAGGGVAFTVDCPAAAESLFVDAGGRAAGFVSDTGVTFTSNTMGCEELRRYDMARAAVDAGAAMLRPGVRPSRVLEAMRQQVNDAALRPQAHGLGISIREWPFFGAADRDPVTEGRLHVDVDTPLVADTVVNLKWVDTPQAATPHRSRRPMSCAKPALNRSPNSYATPRGGRIDLRSSPATSRRYAYASNPPTTDVPVFGTRRREHPAKESTVREHLSVSPPHAPAGRLRDMVTLITGAGSRVGAETARVFHAEALMSSSMR